MASICTQIGPSPFSPGLRKTAFIFPRHAIDGFSFQRWAGCNHSVDFRPGSAEIKPFCFNIVSLVVNFFLKHTGRLLCCALLIRASLRARHPDAKQSVSQNQAKCYPGPTPCNPCSTALWHRVRDMEQTPSASSDPVGVHQQNLNCSGCGQSFSPWSWSCPTNTSHLITCMDSWCPRGTTGVCPTPLRLL